jgi:hypothetical protein
MKPFVFFMASPAGRLARIVAGLALITGGLLSIRSTSGTIIALVGAVPFLAGLLDICLFAPLFSCPLSGAKIRAARQ